MKSKPLTFLKVFNPSFMCSVMLLSVAACTSHSSTKHLGYREASKDLYDATINSLVSSDIYGREFSEADVTSSDRQVGMFYFVWHGEHVNNGIYDVTYFKNNCPDELWDINSTVSKLGEFHYFDEPLYGYYCSDDPWVLLRHIELLTMSGVDYIALDLTNWGIYEKECRALFDKLLELQNTGWKVPLVTEILNGTAVEANHPQRITNFYNIFYKDHKYDSIWYRDQDTNKPVIVITMDQYYDTLSLEIRDNIKFRNTIWPFDKAQTVYDDLSWMDWQYPQRVYNNSYGNHMSVSVTQHITGSFGKDVNPNTIPLLAKNNRGRGFNYDTGKNEPDNMFKGSNLEQQWRNAIDSKEGIDDVFVTGWNEWIAYKLTSYDFGGLSEGAYKEGVTDEQLKTLVDFCDTCDDEFSRDIEMTKNGYGDNFFLQNMRLTREYKSQGKTLNYYGKYVTANLRNLDWSNARTYLDFEGDAVARNYDRADHKAKYINETNRNDIVSTKVSHDNNNLYVQIKTKDNIVIDADSTNNLNVLLSVKDSKEPSWNGYQYVVNRTANQVATGALSIDKVKTNGVYEFDSLEGGTYYKEGNVISMAIPLAQLGIEGDKFTIDLKVADGVSELGNIMDYYIDGDVAPIGRLNYRYNSTHK